MSVYLEFTNLFYSRVLFAIFNKFTRLYIRYCLLLSFFFSTKLYSENYIRCDAHKIISIVNKKILGSNLIAYDPSSYEKKIKPGFKGYTDYGAGIWNPYGSYSVPSVIKLAKEGGIKVLRFPGGCGTHGYDWKKGILKERTDFLFGLNEFLKVCEEINAIPVITVSYFTGDPQDAADLVEYLNSEAIGKNHWALKRKAYGREKPYNVKYFEIGNEVYHGDHRDIKKVAAKDYAERYLKYYKKMKKVDKNIAIGALLYNNRWNETLLTTITDSIDFAVIHTYPTPKWGEALETISAEEIFYISVNIPSRRFSKIFTKIQRVLKLFTGKKVPLAITEFNGGFLQNLPVPYRHTLLNGLVNAELISLFMQPQYNVLFANHWQFSNSYWGMIANGFTDDSRNLTNSYYKRPVYYVFELYHQYFGDFIVKTKTNNIDISVNGSISKKKNNIYLMVVNKTNTKNISCKIDLANFTAKNNIVVRTMNAPKLTSMNSLHNKPVKINTKNVDVLSQNFMLTFPAHSLTSIEFTNDKNGF